MPLENVLAGRRVALFSRGSDPSDPLLRDAGPCRYIYADQDGRSVRVLYVDRIDNLDRSGHRADRFLGELLVVETRHRPTDQQGAIDLFDFQLTQSMDRTDSQS